MLRYTSKPSFLLLFFFLCSTSVIFHSLRVPGGDEKQQLDDEVVPWKTRRSMEEGEQANTTLLAQERTSRKDIFHHFKLYTGGWNISNSYYISSVLSTAFPFFAVAVAWFVIFGLVLHLICVCYCCCSGESDDGYSQLAYALSLIFLILCTIAAIAGCVVLYTSQGEFHGSTSKTLNYVVNQAEFTAENLRNVSDYFDSAKQVVIGVGLPTDVERDIDNVKKKISTAADIVSNKTEDSSQMIQRGIDGMRLALIVVAAVMLFVAILGFLSSILGVWFLVYFLVVVGWILVAGTFILCGAFLFLHK